MRKISFTFFLFFVIFLFLIFPQKIQAATFYISNSGSDSGGCSGGTYNNPWKTYTYPKSNGCIHPGDTVYFKAGTYTKSTTFGGNINFGGQEGSPVTLAAESGSACNFSNSPATCPVKFEGPFTFGNPWGIIDGVEINRGGSSGDVVDIGTSHLTIQNSYVHGEGGSSDYDCIKIYAGPPNQDVKIIGSEIANCVEDCIDVTGAEDIVYRGNKIHDCRVTQVKAGTKNVLIENNRFYNLYYGLQGAPGDLKGDCEQTGNPNLKDLPFEERFNAKNVTIRNNIFYNTMRNAIGAHGWHDVQIYHNTIYNPTRFAILAGNQSYDVGFEFIYPDPYVKAYCDANPGSCGDCIDNCGICSDPNNYCCKVKFPATRNLVIKNNLIIRGPESENYDNIKIDPGVEEGLDFSHNLFYVFNGGVDPSLLTDLENYNFYPLSDSPVIDAGINVGVTSDITGSSRPWGNGYDIGAYEYRDTSFSPSPSSYPNLPRCFSSNNTTIDVGDVLAFLVDFLTSNTNIDINSDNMINAFEFTYLIQNWGKSCSL